MRIIFIIIQSDSSRGTYPFTNQIFKSPYYDKS